MGVSERKGRERAGRERRIIAAARAISETDGWSAVTIRRLADDIEYSQPVIYSHFDSRDAIVSAVAVEGFRELATSLRAAAVANSSYGALEAVATAYLAFARGHPSLYEAMFTMPNGLSFADANTKPELKEAFAALAAVVSRSQTDVEVATEAFWAALHGLAELERSGRIRPNTRDQRVCLVTGWLIQG